MILRKIEFEGSREGALTARLDTPSGQLRAFAIFAHCEPKDGRIDKTIELFGKIENAPRSRLMEIVDRYPVHRTLQSEISIHSKPV